MRPDFLRAAKYADLAETAARIARECMQDDDPEAAATWWQLEAIWRGLEGRELAATA